MTSMTQVGLNLLQELISLHLISPHNRHNTSLSKCINRYAIEKYQRIISSLGTHVATDVNTRMFDIDVVKIILESGCSFTISFCH